MDRVQALGYVVLAITALVYHRLAMVPDRAPRSLVSFGQLDADEAKEDGANEDGTKEGGS